MYLSLRIVLADRLGRKKILVLSLFLFAVTGTACAFTHDFEVLLLLRVLQSLLNIGTAP